MNKINYSVNQFNDAIKKVVNDYADVSNVSATENDVLKGKTFVNSNGKLVEGTLEDCLINSSVEITSKYLTDEINEYPITVKHVTKVDKEGICKDDRDGDINKIYINTEEIVVNPTNEEQNIIHSNGKFISKVTLNKVEGLDGAVLKNQNIIRCVFNQPEQDSASYYIHRAYVNSGAKHDNVYLRDGISTSDAPVYLFPVGTSIESINYIDLVDTETLQLVSGVKILNAGDSVTCTASSYSPGGILAYTQEGHLTFQHTVTWTCMLSNSSSFPMILLIEGVYYVPFVDYFKWKHGYNGVGSHSSSGSTIVLNDRVDVDINVLKRDFYKPKILISNLTNVYFSWYYNSGSSWEPMRMTFNYGFYYPVIVEGE